MNIFTLRGNPSGLRPQTGALIKLGMRIYDPQHSGDHFYVFRPWLNVWLGRCTRSPKKRAGKFDFYILSLSWSPSFCEIARDSARQQQCGIRPYSFVVHGLWPQYEKGFPEFCKAPAPRLDHNIMSSMLDLMPAPKLIFHEWDSHGTCSGLGARGYFNTVREARAMVKIPPEYLNPGMALTVSPGEVIDAFVKANVGLARSAISIDCNRARLREVRICLSRELHFRDCSENSRRTCRSEKFIMPPVRGH